jgi:uncharacterized protein (TIGR03083 family)
MSDRLHILGESVQHLRSVTATIDPVDYTSRAYPSEWTIADAFSHLGSGAVIVQRRLEDSLANREGDPHFNPSVWDVWNAKNPVAQVEDCLASDGELLAALEAMTEEQRRGFHFMMGPFAIDFDGLVGLRLSEHVLHTWDIEVAIDPGATLPIDAANAVLDGIQFIVGRTGKPTGETKELKLRTTNPVRNFTLVLDVDSVELVEGPFDGEPDLVIPNEALVRLIYGRLDAAHTPSGVDGHVLEFLRRVFPGF